MELNGLYSSPNRVRVIKSRRIRWAGDVTCIERREIYTGFRCGNLREIDHWEKPRIEGRIIFKKSSGSGMWGFGLDRAGSVRDR
jgi:hypothetical protein